MGALKAFFYFREDVPEYGKDLSFTITDLTVNGTEVPTNLFSDADLNAIGHALEEWVSSKSDNTPLLLEAIQKTSNESVTVTP